MAHVAFPAEWHPQSGIQIAWPHAETDWRDMLDEVTGCYVAFSKEILKREKLLVVCPQIEGLEEYFTAEECRNLILAEAKTNDTWARDHGGLSAFIGGVPTVFDFGFNAWGLKFAANYDNLVTQELFRQELFRPEVQYRNHLDFVLEGGSIESDGRGTLLATSQCLLAPNRNQPMAQWEIEEFLIKTFGLKRMLWLNHGYLAGDDTDNHIDTLARFCDEQTIAYVRCDDENDEHFDELRAMEKELQAFLTEDGKPYRLIALPMADEIDFEGYRLPATYANFLIINGAVLLPFYLSDKDEIARRQLQKAFPDREIIGVDCRPLIKQHGSLHCVTMQFPKSFF